ncbi:MAG: XRE family transcriptional regulator [Candidatus Thiodiazotropha endolucinida]|nr:XRE family transcriptional regulator [Candidatus Thiodiazotropha sp. (ex Codakia orbicularis)]MBV2126399.1 XRE family transcriptional regulator [Candidatus Thiodiazotropha taylori]MCG7864154.1 XRE family transcriptional regulator [Candidatus Thiodiazotropha endolucinida]MBT3043624.1 XRE family transcriptional regulator [Candidatus Thiodiazotropha sp. (ex Codakia orbicularis)]MCG8047872.1 XRE family transcriptional regulator [Candidatus Thiodiazotropha taylori]
MMAKKYESAFDAIADTPAEALNMRLRADMIHEIRRKVEAKGWTQKEAAERLGITQPRVSDLFRGKLSKFSLDALVNMLAAIGSDVKLKVA